MHYFFILFVLTGISASVLGAEFHSSLPKSCRADAQKSLPDIISLFKADASLVRSTGARIPADLEQLELQFDRSIRLYDFNYEDLGSAGTFSDVLIETNTWSVPLCLESLCKVIALVNCDSESGEAAVQYAGRDLQAKRFKESEIRLTEHGGVDKNGAKIISTDVLDFVFVPTVDPAKSFLIPSSENMAQSLFQQYGRSVFDNQNGSSVDRIDIAAFKKLVAARDALYQDVEDREGSHLSEDLDIGSLIESDDSANPTDLKPAPELEGSQNLSNPVQAPGPGMKTTVLDLDGSMSSSQSSSEYLSEPVKRRSGFWWIAVPALGIFLIIGIALKRKMNAQ